MDKNLRKERRAKRTRAGIRGVTETPRLSVYRSNKSIYAQLIDDSKGTTILGLSEKNLDKVSGTKTEKAKLLGQNLAKEALRKKISKAVFDKGSYKYHGRVKALADGAREGGLKF